MKMGREARSSGDVRTVALLRIGPCLIEKILEAVPGAGFAGLLVFGEADAPVGLARMKSPGFQRVS